MDTTAYLTRQGWLGAGHSLQPGGRGIKKPLLVSKKPNVLGLGKKQHDSHADQWWARAFDSSLKSLAVDADQATGAHHVTVGGSGALGMVHKGRGKWVGKDGLYGNFVRGDGLGGTLTPEDRATKVVEAVKVPEEGLKGEKGKVQRQDCEGDRDAAVLPKKRRKNRKDSNTHGSIVDAGEVSDTTANTRSGSRSRSSKEDRRCRRRERREGAKRGGIQCAIAAENSPASPAEATRTRKRSAKGEVVETQPRVPHRDSRAVVEVREVNEDADSPTFTFPNNPLEKVEKKRRKEERRVGKSRQGSNNGPRPSLLNGKNKGKRKREREDESQ